MQFYEMLIKLHVLLCLILCINVSSFFLSFSAVTSADDVNQNRIGSSSQEELVVIRLAFALTVPGMFILCLGVNFLCYKWGMKKGRASYKKNAKSPDETQAMHYHLYDDEITAQQQRAGPSGGPIVDLASHDYAAYDEIKEQRQRSERKKDGGYITPMSQDRPLPPVGGGDGNGYVSPKSAPKQPPRGNEGKNGDSPSPPGNGGYLSPLEERKLSSNSDSSSDKSRKYQNEPAKKSPKTKGVYESIKDAGVTQEHQYIDLQTTVS